MWDSIQYASGRSAVRTSCLFQPWKGARSPASHRSRRPGVASYKPENGPRRPLSSICTGTGRRPAPTPSAAPKRSGVNAADIRTRACARPPVNRSAEGRRDASANPPSGRRHAASPRSSVSSRPSYGGPNSGPPALTATRSARLSQPWHCDHADAGAFTIAFGERAVQCLRESSKHPRIASLSKVGAAESGAWLRVSGRDSELIGSLASALFAEQNTDGPGRPGFIGRPTRQRPGAFRCRPPASARPQRVRKPRSIGSDGASVCRSGGSS
jgi:hypothetical protein